MAPASEVVARALAWCEGIVASPAVSLSRTRAVARRDLWELLATHRQSDIDVLVGAWFSAPVQTQLARLLARLGKA